MNNDTKVYGKGVLIDKVSERSPLDLSDKLVSGFKALISVMNNTARFKKLLITRVDFAKNYDAERDYLTLELTFKLSS